MAEANKEEHIDPVTTDEDLAPVEITIEGDKSEVKEIGADGVAKSAAEIPADVGVQDLKRQLDAERSARAQAEQNARSQVAQAQRSQVDAQVGMVASAIEAANAAAKEAKKELQAAMEVGDYAKAADAQEKIALGAANMHQLLQQKAEVEYRQRQPASPPANQSRLEQILPQLSAPSQTWLKAHPEVADRFEEAAAIHEYLTKAKGIKPDTPAYFAAVERELGITPADEKPIALTPPASPAPRPRAPQAPVSRDAPSIQTGRSDRVTVSLSAAERAQAREEGMTDAEYARFKVDAIRAGQHSGTQH
jgi:hypothetical protein